MKIFTEIFQLIKDKPNQLTVGSWDMRSMDNDDRKELYGWTPDYDEESAYTKEINGKFYKIVITSINTD
jgi:hypothetical protein